MTVEFDRKLGHAEMEIWNLLPFLFILMHISLILLFLGSVEAVIC